VLAAIADGALDEARLRNWRKLAREQQRLEARLDPRAVADERRRWRAIARAHRKRPARE
jgi:hypothetical protein